MLETTAYLILGLAVTAVLMGALIGSFVTRWNSLKQDMQTLEQLARDE
jgi:hypothetical protein